MPLRRKPTLLVTATVALPVAVLWTIAASQTPPHTPTSRPASTVPAPPAPGYVADQECAACHRAIWQSYQDVGMAKSFYRPSESDVIESFDTGPYHHEPSGRHYEMSIRRGGYHFKRWEVDGEGRPIHELELPVAWVIGSGSNSRGYLYHTPLGELYQLPLVWYVDEARWGMAPGYDSPHHDGVTRPITRECMFCHNAYPEYKPGADAYGQMHLFPRHLPQGTGCQRCHGPGAEHIRLANDLAASLESVLDSIVNPAKLPPDLRDDVCLQCHLQPTSKHTSFVRRLGRDDYSYRPGQPLRDYLVHIDYDEGRDVRERFEINHHPYRLRQSRCFIASDGALSCLTCHDPHRRVPKEQRAAFYRERCLSCHTLEACLVEDMGPDGDCVSCHMPQRRTEDVVHVTMTDHLITRRVDGDPLAELTETPSPPVRGIEFYFPELAPDEPLATVYIGMAGVADGMTEAIPVLMQHLERTRPDTVEPYLELGAALLEAARYGDAIDVLTEALRIDADNALATANIGVAQAGLGQRKEAVETLKHAMELQRDIPDNHYNLAATLARLGRDDEARAHYLQAVALRPNYAVAWMNLGNLAARQQRYGDAVIAYQTALDWDPTLTSAARNLGSAHRLVGSDREAIRIWRHASATGPPRAAIQLDLALIYLLSPRDEVRDPAEGLRFAQRAVELAPAAPQTLLALALAHLDNGQYDLAITGADRAVRIGADKPSSMLIVVLAYDATGRTAEAVALLPSINRKLQEFPKSTRVRDALMQRARTAFPDWQPAQKSQS